jgi:hypothetical protein
MIADKSYFELGKWFEDAGSDRRRSHALICIIRKQKWLRTPSCELCQRLGLCATPLFEYRHLSGPWLGGTPTDVHSLSKRIG